jgi:spore maturation protein CgeB
MNIAFFGSSLVSAYWNGAATYYRGLIRALAKRGHAVTFYESDAFDRQKHRDMPQDPDWAKVVVYSAADTDGVHRCLEDARRFDLVIKCSGNGVFDELLEDAVASLKSPRTRVAFLDVDAPATLDRVHANPADPFLPLIPRYDFVFTYGGGPPVIDAYTKLGARASIPIYNALDPSTHHPVERDNRFAADLSFLGNRLPDREARVEEFFFKAAAKLPDRTFLLGGAGWQDKSMPANVRYLGHVYTRDHNAFNSTPRAVLNISRDSMARYGYSPATRVFEAAGAGACLITDEFVGIETFFEPSEEILPVKNGDEVAETLQSLRQQRAKEIGRAAYRRVLAEHTYDHRAELMERVLEGSAEQTKRKESVGI